MQVKAWFDRFSRPAQWVVFIGAVVALSLIVVTIVCVGIGRTTALDLSNALFFASAVVLLIGLVLFFANRPARPRPKSLAPAGVQDNVVWEENREQRKKLGFYAYTLILAGIILFGLSIVVGSLL